MAQVPYSPVPDVAPAGAPPDDYQHISAKPEQFGAHIAQGVEKAGQGLERASENAFDIAKFQGKINVDYEGNNYLDDRNRILYGDPSKTTIGPGGKPIPDTGYMGLEGRAAADQRQATLDALRNARQAGRKNLKTPFEQLEYDNQTRRIYSEAEQHIGAHAESQWKTWAAGVNQAGAVHSLNEFTRNLNDPVEMSHHARDYIDFKVKEAQTKFGDDPTITRTVVERSKQDLLKAQTDAVAVKDPAEALRILEKNKEIAGTQYDDMYGKLRARSEHQTGQNKANQYVAAATRNGIGTVATLPPATATFFRERSAARVEGINPQFADRLMMAARDFEEANPGRRASFESLTRTRDEQAAAYRRYQLGQGGLAAPPGQSRHEYGYAADIPDGAFLNWMHANAGPGNKYGLEFLRGKNFENDPGHVQVAGALPQGAQPAATNAPAPQPGAMPTATAAPSAAAPPTGALLPTVTMPPAAPHMPETLSAAPSLGEQLAAALRGAVEDPDMNDNERQIAIHAIENRFKVLEITENQNTKARTEAANHAADGYYQRMNDMFVSGKGDWAKLFDDANHDPALDGHPAIRNSLTEHILAKSGGKQALSYGPKFWDLKQAVVAGNMTLEDIYSAPPNQLSESGQKELKSIWHDLQGQEKVGLTKALNGAEALAKDLMIQSQKMGTFSLDDHVGERKFHGEFLQQFNQAFAELKTDKEKWEFLKRKNVEDFVERIYPKRQRDRTALNLKGEAGTEAPQAMPPPPEGVDAKGWSSVMRTVPVSDKTGKPWPYDVWAEAVRDLLEDHSPESMKEFDHDMAAKPGSGRTAADILGKIGAKPETLAAIVSVEKGTRANLEAADKEMHLTPQEKALYERHLTNLTGPGGVDNPDGSRSTLFQTTVEHDGKFYAIPTVWDGKILWNRGSDDPAAEAVKKVQAIGWDKFPSYKSVEEAEARYQQMHHFMERDTAAYFAKRNKPSEPLKPEGSLYERHRKEMEALPTSHRGATNLSTLPIAR